MTDIALAPGDPAGAVRRWGNAVLWAALALALAAVFVLAAGGARPAALMAVPVGLAGIVLVPFLFARPLLNLCVVLVLGVTTIGFEGGIQASEVVYGLYYVGFLAHWFFVRLFVYRERIAPTAGDRAMGLFLIGVLLSTGLTLLFGGQPGGWVGEMSGMALLAFYFPVREACVRYRHGVACMLAVFLWIVLYVALRNLLNYQSLIAATFAPDALQNRRVVMNDNVIMAGTVIGLSMLAFARRLPLAAAVVAYLAVMIPALVLTQSRTHWVAVILAMGAALAFARPAQRGRLAVWVALIIGVGGLAGTLFLGGKTVIVLAGLLRRFSSIGSAATADISFISRFYESRAVWALIERNPVLGYGMGVPYAFHDIILQVELVKTFIHNVYISVLYRFGIWGLVLLLVAWTDALWRGLAASRARHAEPLARAVGMGAALVLLCLYASGLTSNPLHNGDGLLVFGLLTGLCAGIHARVRAQNALIR